MTEKVTIQTTKPIYPQIYAYTLPKETEKNGWIKIGYTKRKDVHERIKEQTKTPAMKLQYDLLWSRPAQYTFNQEYFMDYQFHQFLTTFKQIEREPGTEWFYYKDTPEKAEEDFDEFVSGKRDQSGEHFNYQLRIEQESAVNQTLAYFQEHEGGEFLWNAKPRFGKTLTTYDLMMKMDCHNVLVLTNRPAIADSWFSDFRKFISWRDEFQYKFVSTTDSLKGQKTISHEEYTNMMLEAGVDRHPYRQIAFISMQDLKGARWFGGAYKKLEWVSGEHTVWDLLVIDESHEGKDTIKGEIALQKIKRKATLNLSGTPFKQLSTGNFTKEQIFNWTYTDEQVAKANWNPTDDEQNPYEKLPRLHMFTYQMGPMITKEVTRGANLDGENIDFAFDLMEFFATNEYKKFIHEKEIRQWIDTLTCNEKYPFSTKELRNELKHTLWILDRVDSAKALEKMLREHPVFENYEIVLAAGDGKALDDVTKSTESSLQKVRNAINTGKKTITLSVGQLTTGVTVPEWTAVLMLNNGTSASRYMQAAFRAQNPWEYEENGELRQKERAYVFDFAPERTMPLYEQFANNLLIGTTNGGGTTEVRKENIQQLLNFFPVIAEDHEGKMVAIDVEQVLTIPKTFKAREVVNKGFMSNLLFQNVSGIFASQGAREILEQLKPTEEGKQLKKPKIDTKQVTVDDEGHAVVSEDLVINRANALFGKKVFQEVVTTTQSMPSPQHSTKEANEREDNEVRRVITATFKEAVVEQAKPLGAELAVSKKAVEQIVKSKTNELEREIEKVQMTQRIELTRVEEAYKEKIEELLAEPESQEKSEKIVEAREQYESDKKELAFDQKEELVALVTKKTEELTQKTTKDLYQKAEDKKKTTVEDDVRARLRGFARTIPSFLMAYGNRETTLATFDTTIQDAVFQEVTGITLEQFRALRDTYEFFDEVVFNESVKEFLKKKEELANYFDETQEEDIFDYIPPQQTNQIFTPKRVVKMMVDQLEAEDPTLFEQPDKTFADLYMKSGLYITEIVTRLYKGLEEKIPDKDERIKHILEHQVYGFAPTEIIYHIARNFIFGFDDRGKNISDAHIVHLDTTPYAKGEGDLEKKCDELFGGENNEI